MTFPTRPAGRPVHGENTVYFKIRNGGAYDYVLLDAERETELAYAQMFFSRGGHVFVRFAGKTRSKLLAAHVLGLPRHRIQAELIQHRNRDKTDCRLENLLVREPSSE